MEYYLNEGVLTIELPDKIYTANIEQFNAELESIPLSRDLSEIELNAKKLTYISSVGLRSLLAYKKKNDIPIRVTDLNLETYNVFEMTGFVQLLICEKELRYVDINGLKELGRGMYGSVYKVDNEKILKVFHGVTAKQKLEEILENVREAVGKGIPTILPFEIVKTDLGLGMEFELLNSKSVADMIHEDPSSMDFYVGKMTDLATLMATTEFSEAGILYRDDMLVEEFEDASFVLDKDEIRELVGYIRAVPRRNTAVHGDFHAGNVYMSGGEAILIDMDDFCLGHPVWDIACLYRVYPYMLSLDKDTVRKLFEIEKYSSYPDFYYTIMHLDLEEAKQLWDMFVKKYFASYSDKDIEGFIMTARFYSDLMVIRFLIDQCRKNKDNPKKLEEKHEFIKEIMSGMRANRQSDLINQLTKWRK